MVNFMTDELSFEELSKMLAEQQKRLQETMELLKKKIEEEKPKLIAEKEKLLKEREPLAKKLSEIDEKIKKIDEKLALIQKPAVKVGKVRRVVEGGWRSRVANYINSLENNTTFTTGDVRKATGMTSGYLGNILQEFYNKGFIDKIEKGLWRKVRDVIL